MTYSCSRFLFAGWIAASMVGCATVTPAPVAPVPDRMTAKFSPIPIRVDGSLDEPAWQTAEVYPLNISRADQESGRFYTEPGTVRFCWDNEFLYVAVDFKDSDIVAEGEENQLHHYQMGDLAEVFIKPAGAGTYWELYVTPRSLSSTFFFPGRGRGLPSSFSHHFDLPVAARISGTLNDWRDRDQGWTAEMAIPVKEITAYGAPFGTGTAWKVLIGRYNYGAYLSDKELSEAPRFSKTNFHLLEEYADLILVQ